AALREQLDDRTPDGQHVIDLPGRLRRAWQFAHFRLFVLTLAIGAALIAGENHSGLAAPLVFLSVFLFCAWSVAQFRKRGLAQMLLKWLVYALVLIIGGACAGAMGGSDRPPVYAGMLALALVLTLTKISKWFGAKIRMHFWESHYVHVVRNWF